MFSKDGLTAFAHYKDHGHLMASHELLQNYTTAKRNKNEDVFVSVLC